MTKIYDLSYLAVDSDRWITVHPNGAESTGTPVKIDENGIVKAGMGGKFNGMNIRAAHESKGRQSYSGTKYQQAPEKQSLIEKHKDEVLEYLISLGGKYSEINSKFEELKKTDKSGLEKEITNLLNERKKNENQINISKNIEGKNINPNYFHWTKYDTHKESNAKVNMSGSGVGASKRIKIKVYNNGRWILQSNGVGVYSNPTTTEGDGGVNAAMEYLPEFGKYITNTLTTAPNQFGGKRKLLGISVAEGGEIFNYESNKAIQSSISPKYIQRNATEEYQQKKEMEKSSRKYLRVPYAEKDKAKKEGAKWDADKRQWYFPNGELPESLKKYVADCVNSFEKIAFDSSTAREIDHDGRLRVNNCHISKAIVNDYFGREIRGHESLGLDPDKIYRMYRDPEELKKSAPTFDGLQLLSKHVPAFPNDPQKDITVGSVGNVSFDGKYLNADLVFWDGQSIWDVLEEIKDELSSAYQFDADMTPGKTADGVEYDGVMRNIKGNHVALVEQGRAGHDVRVADEKTNQEERLMLVKIGSGKFKALKASALLPRLQETRVLAQDADIEGVEKLVELLVNEVAEPEGAHQEYSVDEDLMGMIGGASEEQIAQIRSILSPAAADEESEEEKKAREGAEAAEKEKSKAMDADAIAAEVSKRLEGMYAAKQVVELVVGTLPVMDSAESIYREGLKALGVDTKDVHKSAFKVLFDQASKAKQHASDSTPKQSVDSSAGFYEMFPEAARVKTA